MCFRKAASCTFTNAKTNSMTIITLPAWKTGSRLAIIQYTRLFLLSAFIFSASICKAQNITTGLKQYYPFLNGPRDESNQSPDAKVFQSNYSRDMHGYVEGSPTLVGNSYYIEFPDSVKLGTAGWTYSVWFKLYALPGEVCDGDAFLLSYKTTVNGDDVHLFVDDEDNRIKVFFKSGGFKISTGTVVQKGRWYHAVVRYTATSTDVFVDGNFSVSSAGRFTFSAAYSPLLISSTITYPANKGKVFGNIDDIRMYKRNLTNADINFLYTTEKNMVAPPPKKDTIYKRDTLWRIDTLHTRDTIFIRDTLVNTIIRLDTIILGGNCIVYPNPVSRSGRLYIQTNDRPITVTIYNTTGQFMRRENLTTQDYISMNNLPAGTYYIKIVSPTGTCGKRIVVF